MLHLYNLVIEPIRARFENQEQGTETGATAVEYGLMVSLIAIVIIIAVTAIGTNLMGIFNTVGTAL